MTIFIFFNYGTESLSYSLNIIIFTSVLCNLIKCFCQERSGKRYTNVQYISFGYALVTKCLTLQIIYFVIYQETVLMCCFQPTNLVYLSASEISCSTIININSFVSIGSKEYGMPLGTIHRLFTEFHPGSYFLYISLINDTRKEIRSEL